MATEPEVVTPVVSDEDEHYAHIPVTDNGKAFCSTVKDHNNPYSVWSLSPQRLKNAIDRCPDDLFLLAENQLSPMVNHDPRLRALRVAFHREYERVITYFQRTGNLGQIKINNIFGGIISDGTFERFLQKPEAVVYMTMPLVDYHDTLRSLGVVMLARYEEILQAPLYDAKGNFKAANADVVLRAMKTIEDRIFGQSVQRVSSENKSVQVTVPVPPRSIAKTTDMMLVLEHRVKELQAELYGIRQLGERGQLDGPVMDSFASTPARHLASGDCGADPNWAEKRVQKLLAKEGELFNGDQEGKPASDH